ncbi:MAG: hypothetical protein GAK45_01261 [Pseudomonas citronellolis]|nr:MAG: hypothetical protein GAK45_01261 [Pseudomonas citronellolis]
MRVPLICLLLAVALPASAEIYKYTDANGKTVFTNQPPGGVNAKPVTLPPTNSVDMPTPRASGNAAPAETPFQYTILAISGLPDSEALRANNGNFGVDVTLQPALQMDHQLRLRLDGQPYGAPSRSTHFELTNIDRGEHTLIVDVMRGDRVLQSSAPASFALQRSSLNNPPRLPPPTPPKAPTKGGS